MIALYHYRLQSVTIAIDILPSRNRQSLRGTRSFGENNVVANNTFNVNCLNAASTPIWTGGSLPPGTIYRMDITGSGVYPGSLPLYIV